MPLRIFLGLALCNSIWATTPAVGKIALQHFSPLQCALLRYLFAYLSLVISLPLFLKKDSLHTFLPKKQDWFWLTMMGFTSFCASPFFQYKGLASSTATANTVMVATEPLLCALFAWLFLREHMQKQQIISLVLALTGFYFLSKLYKSDSHISSEVMGNIFIFIAIANEAFYNVVCKKVRHEFNSIALMIYALTIGLALLTFLTWREAPGLPVLANLDGKTLLAFFWMGTIATAFPYLYWSITLKKVPVASAALTLFIQPLLGSIIGFSLLNERLNLAQSLGAALIIFALLFSISKTRAPTKLEI